MFTRHLVIIVLILVFAPGLNAQEAKNDVVYLNNGTFLRGTISELIPGKSLKIYFNGHDTLEIPMSDVKEIKKEVAPEKPGYDGGVKASGYTNITEFPKSTSFLQWAVSTQYVLPPQPQCRLG